MLPTLLAELKSRGYRIVHVVPGAGERVPLPELVARSPTVPRVRPSLTEVNARTTREVTGSIRRSLPPPARHPWDEPVKFGPFGAIFAPDPVRW